RVQEIRPVTETPRHTPANVESIRRHPLESILLFRAALALAATMVATLWVALRGADRTEDLTFAGTTRELSRALEINGPDRIGRLDSAWIVVGNDTLLTDTIVVTADSIAEPSVAKGGF